MNADTEKKISRLADILYYGALICAVPLALRLTLRYVLPATYPFIIAYFIAMLLSPVMAFLKKHAGIPHRAAALVSVVLAVSLVSGLIYLLADRAVFELGRLTKNLDSKAELKQKVVALFSSLPFTDGESVWAYLEEKLTASLPGLNTAFGIMTKTFTGVADFAFAFFVTVVACYYMTVDRAKIAALAYKLLPKSAEKRLHSARVGVVRSAGRFLKAYGLILFITFAELLAAFSIMQLDYAVLLAAAIALVDILPVLGTGTVLVPWALICMFVTKDLYTGIGLLVTYVTITVIRQIIEPKIVGSFMGLHPLATLFAMFAGLKTAGILGMLLFPPILQLLSGKFTKDAQST